jgi:hypothetical protein
MWKLKDVLAAAGEPPMTTFSANEDTDEYLLVKQVLPIAPCSVGVGQTLSIFASRTGLPTWLSIDERRGLRLAIINALHDKTLTWKEPISTFSQMKLTLEDKQHEIHDAYRLAKLILRAQPIYQGRPAFDNIKLQVEEERGCIRVYFGKCLAFFKDHDANMFVGVRWFEPADGHNANLIDPIVKLAQIKLATSSITRSYAIMPAHSIVNGALILRVNDKHWAIQSPREQTEYCNNTFL